MRKKALVLALAMVMVLGVVVGCGGDSGDTPSTPPATGSASTPPETTTPVDTAPVSEPPAASPEASDGATSDGSFSVVMVTDVGGVNDESFNQSAWEGLQRAESELGVEVSYIESKQNGDYIPNLEQALQSDPDIIWGVGYMMSDAILEAAKTNPNQLYALVDSAYSPEQEQPDNLLTVNFKAEEGSFLVGYIAGKTTKSNKVGFVGGMDSPLINAFQFGYEAGVKQANKDIEISVQYAENFGDAAKGKSIAQQMYKDGCDVVYHAAGQTGVGVIEAAKEQGEGKWAIGVDMDQYSLAPENMLTSAMKNVGTGMYLVIEDYVKNDNFKGGGDITYGLVEDGVGYAPTSGENTDAAVLEETESIAEKIKSGEIVVPATKEDLDAFVGAL